MLDPPRALCDNVNALWECDNASILTPGDEPVFDVAAEENLQHPTGMRTLGATKGR